ncbi:MAG: hypothetical protein KAS32_18095 [Candidatus Peribacteraceae bacterium]|nr:hypothetical protein [Candidatus Peribacteraceae bacterium]
MDYNGTKVRFYLSETGEMMLTTVGPAFDFGKFMKKYDFQNPGEGKLKLDGECFDLITKQNVEESDFNEYMKIIFEKVEILNDPV